MLVDLVLVDEATLVELASGDRDPDGHTQELLHVLRHLEQLFERLPSGILEHRPGSTVILHEFQRPRRPRPSSLFFNPDS